MRQDDSRRPVWEFADRVQITRSVLEAQWKVLVFPPPSRRLLRYSPSARPYVLAIVVSLRHRGRSSVGAAFDQQGPDDAGHLVGQSDGNQHFRLASQHLRKPDPLRSLPSAGRGIFQLGRTCHSFPCGWSAEVCQHRPLVSSRHGAGLFGCRSPVLSATLATYAALMVLVGPGCAPQSRRLLAVEANRFVEEFQRRRTICACRYSVSSDL